jgi:hypothetical protein
MSATTEQTKAAPTAIDILKSIDAKLGHLITLMQAAKPKRIASDAELDGQWGAPEVKMLPKNWKGDQGYLGRRLCDCPVGLLDMLSEMYDYFADRAEAKNEMRNGKPAWTWDRSMAEKARGWAKRIREGQYTPPDIDATTTSSSGDSMAGWYDDPNAPWN